MHDLNDLNTAAACEVPTKYEFKHPVTKQGLGMGVLIYGKDSKTFNELSNAQADADRQRAFKFTRRGKAIEPKTAAESKADAINLLVGSTCGFWCDPIVADPVKEQKAREGGAFLWFNGEKIEFTEQNARKFFADFPEGLRQVDEAITDLENFMKA